MAAENGSPKRFVYDVTPAAVTELPTMTVHLIIAVPADPEAFSLALLRISPIDGVLLQRPNSIHK
jgi:hypothetical protein